jgi:3',5'-cyclic AMP phosphodiesterase CpdA
VVLVAAGDIATSGPGDAATAALIGSINPYRVLTLGDNAYDSGTLAQYNSYYEPTWGAFKAKTNPSPGNHDYATANAGGYRSYFGWPASPLYNSFEIGSWHIIILDSEIDHSAGSAQLSWLAADLAANPNACTIAVWHKPRWSSGTAHGSDASYQPFWDTLAAANVDVILNGHEHNYERFAPIQGIREFVVGTGGASHYGLGTPLATSQVRNSTAFGVLKLTLSAGSYSWQFMPEAGQTFTDSGSEVCH